MDIPKIPIGLSLLVLWMAGNPAHSASVWDVHPTPLEQIETAGIDADIGTLTDILGDMREDPDTRVLAAMALAQMNAVSAVNELQAATEDADVKVRTGAINALAHFPSYLSIGVLRRVLTNDPEDGPRLSAVIALGIVGTDEAASILTIAALSQLEAERTRMSALSILGYIGSQSALDELVVLLDDPNPDIRGKAAIVLSQGVDTRYIDRLVAAALDPETGDYIYIEAVQRLEQIAGRDFRPKLEGVDISRQRIRDWWAGEEQIQRQDFEAER